MLAQVMESAEMDPCKFLATPAWHVLAGELLALGSSNSCSDRLVFVVAAASILATYAQRPQQTDTQSPSHPPPPPQQQQQQQECARAGVACVQELLRQLQQLSRDPTAGVRMAVAAGASSLLAQGAPVQDIPMDATAAASGSGDSLQEAGAASTASVTYSSTATSREQQDGSRSADRRSSTGGSVAKAPLGAEAAAAGCSGGGFNSLSSSGVLSAPATGLAVLQDCLQRLQWDECVSVAEAAKGAGYGGLGGSSGGCDGGGGDAGAADAAGFTEMPAGGAESTGNRMAAGAATDLL
jgi:hypothetical protein